MKTYRFKGDKNNGKNLKYKDLQGKTVIKNKEYIIAFTDSISSIGFVGTKKGKIICVDNAGKELFEAYKVEMEQEAEPEKKKVVLGQPAAASDDAEATPAANVNTANAVKAPLPGTITSIEVAVGQEVKAGDTVVVLEAMKMQNNIEAEKDGKVTAICVKPGQAVLEEDALVVIE